MQQIYSYLILGAYCLYAFFYLPVTAYTVAGLLAAVSILCFSYFFNRRSITGILAAAYITTGFFFPQIFLFFPLLMGELYRMNLYLPIILAAFGFAAHYPPLDILQLANHAGGKSQNIFLRSNDITLENLCYVLLGCLLAIFLNRLCTRISDLELQFKKTRDDSAEINFLLQERNRLLIERQDYQIHTAMLQERTRIAREIHDNAGHMLSRCILLTGMIKTMNRDEKCAESLQLLDSELARTMDTMRDSVHNLHNEALDLKEKIRELLNDFVFCPVSLDYDMGTDTPANIKYTFLAITKEALTNIAKHSNASSAHIRIMEHPAMYQLIISDNGTTLQSEEVLEDGMGLQSIRERVNSLHGTLQLINDSGFRIFVSIPIEKYK